MRQAMTEEWRAPGNRSQDTNVLWAKEYQNKTVLYPEIKMEGTGLRDKGRGGGRIDRQLPSQQITSPARRGKDESAHSAAGRLRKGAPVRRPADEPAITWERNSQVAEATNTLSQNRPNKIADKHITAQGIRREPKADPHKPGALVASEIQRVGQSPLPEPAQEVTRPPRPVVQLDAVDEGYQMHLNVDGGQLGPLELKVDVADRGVRATVIVESSEAARTVQSCEAAIRRALEQQNLQLSSFQVRQPSASSAHAAPAASSTEPSSPPLDFARGDPAASSGSQAVNSSGGDTNGSMANWGPPWSESVPGQSVVQLPGEIPPGAILRPEPAGNWEFDWGYSQLVDLVA